MLSNDTDAIILTDQYGQLVDQVHWQANVEPRPNGVDIAARRWLVREGPQFGRGDRGTPGAASDCTQRPHLGVVINEVHIDAAALSDTVAEWFELYNAGTETVDLNGWVLRDDDYDTHSPSRPTTLALAPGATFVLGRDTEAERRRTRRLRVQVGLSPVVENADEINLHTTRPWSRSTACPGHLIVSFRTWSELPQPCARRRSTTRCRPTGAPR